MKHMDIMMVMETGEGGGKLLDRKDGPNLAQLCVGGD